MSVVETAGRKRMSADERRGQILHAARTVFLRQGLAGARTREIAAEAGVNEALLYRHFASKEELFDAAVVEPLKDAVAHLLRDSGAPPANTESSRDEMVERTRLFVIELITVMQEIAPLLGVMIFNGDSSASEHYKRSVAPIIKQVGDIVRTNLDWWDHRDFDPDSVVRTIFGAIWFELTAARLQRRRVKPAVLATDIAEMVILGLATRSPD